MTAYEIISIVFTSLGFIISIISLVKSHKADKTSQTANRIAQGEIELNIHQMINQTKKDVRDITLTVAEKGNNTDILAQAFNSALESNLNAYDEACSKYLDNKVDKERFKRNYSVEIRQLVENKNYKKYFDANTSPYKCILKVYHEWNNLES
ncbi:MAG: hypothetical protein UH080_07955 [Ruminococcus sp.]|nr:hypothetical protein [Ruminococcus sp.]